MIEIVPIDFLGQGALLEPKDRKLHDLAVDYCNKNLQNGKDVNFACLAKVWVGLKDRAPFGLMGYVPRLDVPLFRATDADVLRAMAHRLNDYFADNGSRGQLAFLHIGHEAPELRCPEWKKVLKEFHAQSAERVAIEVK